MMKTFPKLYKKSSTGKITEWCIRVEPNDGGFVIKTISGYIDGKKTETLGKHVKKGRNIGKANGTTAEEQAISEAQSAWNKKRDRDAMVEDIDEVNNLVVLPMLALPFEKRSHDIKYPAIGQPKLDGVRCLAQRDGDIISLKSRKGKEFPHLNHIRKTLETLLPKDFALDGELYSTEIPFEEITGIVRKEKLKDGDDQKMLLIKYNVYDCIFIKQSEIGFSLRYEYLKTFCNTVNSCITLVKNEILNDENDVKTYHDKFVAEGYEGLMIRNMNGVYGVGKRSKHLQKHKNFKTEEYKIVGYEEASGNDIGTIIFVCETESGDRFNARPKGSREQRKEWFNKGDKLIGKMLTVRFQELSETEIPRFPVAIVPRDYE